MKNLVLFVSGHRYTALLSRSLRKYLQVIKSKLVSGKSFYCNIGNLGLILSSAMAKAHV